MKRVCLGISLVALVALWRPERLVAKDESATEFKVDLDWDGLKETVEVRPATETDGAQPFFLSVKDSRGRQIWSSPTTAKTSAPLTSGREHFGTPLPQIVADVDSDRAVELVARLPQGDVRPVVFRVLRWDGKTFVPARVGQLVETPAGSGLYPWATGGLATGRWIHGFLGRGADGSLTVEIWEYSGIGVLVKSGQAVVTPMKSGFKVIRWTRPLAPLESSSEKPPR